MTPWIFFDGPQEWRRYWDVACTNLAANVTLKGKWRAYSKHSDDFEQDERVGNVEAAKTDADLALSSWTG